jgi:hypothetical protein
MKTKAISLLIACLIPLLLQSQIVSQWSNIIERSTGNPAIEFDSNQDIIFVGGNKVIKFDPEGNEIWNKTLIGEAFFGTNGLAFDHLKIDESDNIYVLHNQWNGVYGELEERTVFLSKYSPNGNELWTTEFIQENEFLMRQATSIIIYNDKIFVTGHLRNGATVSDGFLWCVSAITGGEIWQKRSSTAFFSCISKIVRIDENGFLYSIGQNGNNSYCIAQYDTEGAYIWNAEYQVESDSISSLSNVLINNNNELTITGSGFSTFSFNDAGDFLWHTQPPSVVPANHGSERIADLFLLDDGNSIITGDHIETFNSVFDTDVDAYTIKLDNNGNILWSYRHQFGEDDRQTSNTIDQDLDGNIIVAGTEGAGLHYKFLINKYDIDNGNLIWSFLDTEDESAGSEVTSLKISSNSEIYIAGTYWEGNTPQFMIKKYNTPLTNTIEPAISQDNLIVYPNPSNNKTFQISTSNSAQCDIIITNSTGKRVFYQQNYSNEKPIRLTNVPSGLYYITVTSASSSISRSIIID